jgi:hypothetical protein
MISMTEPWKGPLTPGDTVYGWTAAEEVPATIRIPNSVCKSCSSARPQAAGHAETAIFLTAAIRPATYKLQHTQTTELIWPEQPLSINITN